MARPRVREIVIENLRTIEKVRLRTSGLTVLIGENGSGKSSILEAIELLRRVGAGTFERDFHEVHGGTALLLRKGATRMALGVSMEDDAGVYSPLRYRVEVLDERSGRYSVDREFIDVWRSEDDASGPPTWSGAREGTRGTLTTRGQKKGESLQIPHRQVLQHPEFGDLGGSDELGTALAKMEVHVGFEVTPYWVARAHRRETALRDRSQINREEHLARLGTNLASSWHTLKNEHPYNKRWRDVLDWVRLGLGYHIDDVLIQAAGAGFVELSLKLRGVDDPIRSAALSNGQLAWLAFVAMAHLGVEERSILAFDEPELHLHPALLVRATQLLAKVAEEHPVVLATHSRRILDALGDRAADAAVLCEYVPEPGVTRLRRFDAEALAEWLTRYEGLGQILDAGYEQHVLAEVNGASGERCVGSRCSTKTTPTLRGT